MTLQHDEQKQLAKHQAIQLVRELIRGYPHVSLFQDVIDVLGETPDEGRLRACFKEWVKRGYNPRNLAWLFDWYALDRIGYRPTHQREPSKPSLPAPSGEIEKLDDGEMMRLLEYICPSDRTFPEFLERLIKDQQLTEEERDKYLEMHHDRN